MPSKFLVCYFFSVIWYAIGIAWFLFYPSSGLGQGGFGLLAIFGLIAWGIILAWGRVLYFKQFISLNDINFSFCVRLTRKLRVRGYILAAPITALLDVALLLVAVYIGFELVHFPLFGAVIVAIIFHGSCIFDLWLLRYLLPLYTSETDTAGEGKQ